MRSPWLLLAVPLVALAVEAQAPVAPALTLMVMDVPAGPATMRPSGEHELPFRVHVLASNFACAADATLPLEISDASSGRPAFLRAHGNPPTANVTIPAGAYAADARPFEATVDAKLMIMVDEDAPSHAHTLEVRAAFPGGLPTGCQAPGAFPAAESIAEHAVQIAADALPGGRETNATGVPAAESGAPVANETPGAGLLLLAAAAATAAIAGRRR